MKKYVSFILLLLFSIPIIAQDNVQLLYEKKIRNFSRMSGIGWAMAGVGTGVALTGGVLLLTLDDDNDDLDEDEGFFDEMAEDIVVAEVGAILLCAGVGLFAGGVTMVAISSHKVKYYKGKLNTLSLGLSTSPNCQGLKLVYRF